MSESTIQRNQKNSVCVPFDNIQSPGAYVSQQGDLFRVPAEALAEGRSPVINWTTHNSNLVTLITDDPWAPVSKIRQLAANADMKVNF